MLRQPYIALALLLGLSIPSSLLAEVMFLEPTPYLSIDDNPFDLTSFGPNVYFEDFEDGSLDVPDGVTYTPYEIRTPGPATDSVDADDGVIDGSGLTGHSLTPHFGYTQPTTPTTWVSSFIMSFDDEFGFAPTHFGSVVTDAMPPSIYGCRILIQVRELDDTVHTGSFLVQYPSGTEGDTSDDLFFGAISSIGLKEVRINHHYIGNDFELDAVEFDHLLLARVVPEPALVDSMALVAGFILAGLRFCNYGSKGASHVVTHSLQRCSKKDTVS